MSTIIVVILLLVAVLVVGSIVLSRTTYQVQSAPDTEYLELEGNWIRYRVAGGGPPVVLVHGWLTSGEIWERLAGRLAQRFTVYTLDLTGFGESDKPRSGYGVRYGSRLLYAFCAHFGLTRAAVIGHDLGGAMAVKLAADHPDVVGRIILVATPADEDQLDLPTLLWLATLPVVGPIFYTLGRLLRPLRRLWMRPFVLDSENLTEEAVDDSSKATPAAVTKTLSVMRREIARGRLTRQAGIVKVPVLVIAGEEDQIVDPQAAEDWARTVSAEVVFLEECGHLPMLERPGEFDARVLVFLTGDQRYLDTITEWPEEIDGEGGGDVTAAEMPEESSFPARAEPGTSEPGTSEPGASESEPPEDAPSGDRPNVIRKQDGRYPPRDRSYEEAEDRYDASHDPSNEQHSDPNTGNGAERRPRSRPRRAGDEAGPLPEIPRDLFEWPDSLKEARPWDRSRETGRPIGEEPGEDVVSDEEEPGEEVDSREDAEPPEEDAAPPEDPREGPRP
jgi:pimeloyl-ACP methyl ester carboxylesterase